MLESLRNAIAAAGLAGSIPLGGGEYGPLSGTCTSLFTDPCAHQSAPTCTQETGTGVTCTGSKGVVCTDGAFISVSCNGVQQASCDTLATTSHC